MRPSKNGMLIKKEFYERTEQSRGNQLAVIDDDESEYNIMNTTTLMS